jgi:ABC-2 type transport system ATP-binding protein
MKQVIRVENLNKYYNGKQVLNNISFCLNEGESLGVLGSNGAGKSTLLETIEGLRTIEDGKVTVLGEDVSKNYKSIQEQIGIQLQKTSLFGELSVAKNLKLYAGLYNKLQDIDMLMKKFDLINIQSTIVNNLSGGQFQRLNLCIAMLNNPAILFLDEPTTGLDIKGRKALWEKIKALKQTGCSVILTTHHMEEAEELCDRVIILHKGKILANDAPHNLIRGINRPEIIKLEIEGDYSIELFAAFDCKRVNNKLYIKSLNLTRDLIQLLNLIERASLNMIDIGFHQASLEDVYLEFTDSEILQEDITV